MRHVNNYTHYYPSLIGTNGQAYIENYQENDTQYESTLNYSNIFENIPFRYYSDIHTSILTAHLHP